MSAQMQWISNPIVTPLNRVMPPTFNPFVSLSSKREAILWKIGGARSVQKKKENVSKKNLDVQSGVLSLVMAVPL